MKSVLSLFAFASLRVLVTAIPVAEPISSETIPRDAAAALEGRALIPDTSAGWSTCEDYMVIFARGTLDSGDMGVWVGPDFQDGLNSNLKSVAFQGVSAESYPASLDDYIQHGGSASGSAAMAASVDTWATKCPNAKFVISGWSQGALVAWNATMQITTSKPQVKALVTFGDPNVRWYKLQAPAGIAYHSACITDATLPDPLCADPLPASFKPPTTKWDLIDTILRNIMELPVGLTAAAQIAAVPTILSKLTVAFTANIDQFAEDLAAGNFWRWGLTPQHFKYGDNGMAGDMAKWIAENV